MCVVSAGDDAVLHSMPGITSDCIRSKPSLKASLTSMFRREQFERLSTEEQVQMHANAHTHAHTCTHIHSPRRCNFRSCVCQSTLTGRLSKERQHLNESHFKRIGKVGTCSCAFPCTHVGVRAGTFDGSHKLRAHGLDAERASLIHRLACQGRGEKSKGRVVNVNE